MYLDIHILTHICTLMHMCTLKGGVGLFNVVETNLGSSDPFT